LKNEINLFKKVHTNITFIIDLDEDISYFILDKVQFRQVIDNLINNSIKIINQDNHEDGQIFL
jgi:signal transduction histidine kinase